MQNNDGCLRLPSTGYNHGRRGQWAVYYTSPQGFMTMFSCSLTKQLWGLFFDLIGWFIKLSVQIFQSPIVIYRRGIIIGDVHKFIGHCLFSLDPWTIIMHSRETFVKYSARFYRNSFQAKIWVRCFWNNKTIFYLSRTIMSKNSGSIKMKDWKWVKVWSFVFGKKF